MQEFSRNRSSRIAARRPVIIAACAVLLVGGGAFAAAGGVDLIKRLFVTVDIGGTPVQLELQPAGDNTYVGTMNTDLGEGRQAQIHVKRVDSGNANELNTQVHVNVNSENGKVENNSEIAIRKGFQIGAEAGKTYSMDDIGDAEPAHEWTNSHGDARAIYLVPTDDNQVRIFSVTTPEGGEATVRMLTKLPAAMGFEGTPEVTTDDKDMITLTWGGQDGSDQKRRVIKLVDRTTSSVSETRDPSAPLSVDTPDGQIKVKIETTESADGQ